MITYSVEGSIFRSTKFNRAEFRKFGMSSGLAEKEFSASVDLTEDPLPTLPLAITMVDITTIKFLFLEVTGGDAVIRLGNGETSLDMTVSGSILLSDVQFDALSIVSTPNSCFIEIFGMGS